MSDRDSVTPLAREADIRVATGNRPIPPTPTDQILGRSDSPSCRRFSLRLSGARQPHRAPQRYPSPPARPFGPPRSRRTRVDRALRSAFAKVILFLVLLPPLLLAAKHQDPPLPSASVVSPLPSDSTVSPLEFARVAGQVEILSAQLTAQYEHTGQTLDTINTIITVYTALSTFLVLVLGIFGYRNLRSDLQRSLESKIDEQLRDSVSERVDEFLAEKEHYWDERLAGLLRRVTRLSDRRS